MLFVEFRFLFFAALVFGVHWLLKGNRARKVWLLGASYVFYGAWDWRFLSLILISTFVDFYVGRALGGTDDAGRRKRLLAGSLVLNLGLLGFFKYYHFFVDSGVEFLQMLGVPAQPSTLEILLPVGISFYTFQTLSYSIDVYYRKLEPTPRLLDFALFVAFFPQLVAGPIVRAKDFLPQLDQPMRFDTVRVRPALVLFLVGFFKKACVSDNVAPWVDAYYAQPQAFDGVSAVLGTFLYAVQIYCDFSGYSDMAIACAALLGYRLCENFDHPYFAVNIAEFWRRWHISLSSWLRDYLYIPLGGNRLGTRRTYINLMLTMLLGGLWHGAAWTFIAWGAIHGVALAVHRMLGGLWKKIPDGPATQLLGMAVTFYLVNAAWIFFRASRFDTAWTVLQGYTTLSGPGAWSLPAAWWGWLVLLAALHALAYRLPFERAAAKLPPVLFAVLYGAVFAVCLSLVPTGYRPFIYFQF